MTADAPATKPKRSTATIVLVVVAVVVVLAVPCIGVLAAIAIPSFVNYTRRSKAMEARSNLRSLATSVETYCARERLEGGPGIGARVVSGSLPRPTGPIPRAIPAQAAVFSSELAADPVFSEIGFAPADPIRYAYAIVADGEAILLQARGDLDQDGVASLYEIRCARTADGCACDRTVRVENEME